MALAVCILIPMSVIVTYVGLHNYGNVGLDANSPLSEYTNGIRISFQKDLKWYRRFGILFCLILLTYWDYLKKLWKEILLTIENVYYWTEESGSITKECDATRWYDESYYEEQNFEDMDIVVMYNEEDRHWCYEPGLDLSDFSEIPCGTLTMYVRNGSVKNVIKPQVEGLKIHF